MRLGLSLGTSSGCNVFVSSLPGTCTRRETSQRELDNPASTSLCYT